MVGEHGREEGVQKWARELAKFKSRLQVEEFNLPGRNKIYTGYPRAGRRGKMGIEECALVAHETSKGPPSGAAAVLRFER